MRHLTRQPDTRYRARGKASWRAVARRLISTIAVARFIEELAYEVRGERTGLDLANDGVEHRIGKRQSLGVRLTPHDSRRAQSPRRVIGHRLIEIGRVDRSSLG